MTEIIKGGKPIYSFNTFMMINTFHSLNSFNFKSQTENLVFLLLQYSYQINMFR